MLHHILYNCHIYIHFCCRGAYIFCLLWHGRVMGIKFNCHVQVSSVLFSFLYENTVFTVIIPSAKEEKGGGELFTGLL